MGSSGNKRYPEGAALFLIGILWFVWPIPHTISIREGSVILSVLLFGYIAYKGKSGEAAFRRGKPLIYFYVLFTAWILFLAIFISEETVWTLKEIKGQWGTGLMAFAAALIASGDFGKESLLTPKRVFMIIFAALFVHVLYIDIYAINHIITHGEVPSRVAGLTGGMDKSNYLSNHLFMILAAEVFFRWAYRKSFLPFNATALVSAIFITLFSFYIEFSRNGMVVAVMMTIAFVILFMYEKRSLKTAVAAGLVIVVMGAYGIVSFKSDKRWSTLMDTVPIALDTETNRAWLNHEKYPYPMLNGVQVNLSNYERIAWFKEGIVLVAENPLGIGFGRNAFGHGLMAKYNEDGPGHSHSGILDLTIGTGIPGLLIWLSMFFYVLYASLRTFVRTKSYFALMFFFIAGNFALRMLVDSIIRDHMLQQFMFLTGFLFVLMAREAEEGGAGLGVVEGGVEP